MTAPISCFVADDHPPILDAVTRFLEQNGIRVVGTARDGRDAIEQIVAQRPQVALVDLAMPRANGIEVARAVARRAPATGVVLYTGAGDRALLTEAIDAGARGFVLKEAPLADLVRAIQMVASGDVYVDPVVAGVFATSVTTERLPQLTQRERDVLRLLADGLSNDEIGKRLFISADTVRTHVRKAMAKLDADTRTQAVATALRQSLIS